MEQVLAGLAAIFPGPYLHIGADEPRGMPDEVYASYVRRLRRLVRSSASNRWAGRSQRGLAWVRAALSSSGVAGVDLPASAPPQVRAQVEAEVASCGAATPRRWRWRRCR